MAKLNDLIKIKGEATITFCDVSTPESKAMEALVKNARGEEYRTLVAEFNRRFGKRKIHINNLCPTVGRAVLAALS